MNSNIFQNAHVLIEEVLKKSPVEDTQIVYLNGLDGKRVGPYIRKIFNLESGLGNAYKIIFECSNKQISNKYLPNIYSVFEKDNKLYVFEEYLQAQTLDKFMAQNCFDINLLTKIFIDLCNAVNFLHCNFSSPIIHRDIKPSNILISNSGQVKLIDFGISRNFEENASADTHKFGTVGYASPEQFGYAQTDIRSDIYSLGKVLEFMCESKNWKTTNAECLVRQFQEVINKACQFDPKARYQSVNLMLKNFNKICNNSSNKFMLALGHIWNVLLSVIIIFFIFVVFATIFDPNNVNYQMSIGQKICYCTMMIVFIFFGIWAGLTYKPSLRQIFKKLPRFKLLHYVIFILACIAGITICALIAQLF